MGMYKEFKKFAMRGNVVDLAVGIIIGGAFSQITNSLVKDIIMPPIGLIMGEVDLAAYKILLRDAVPAEQTADGEALAEVAITYGQFINVMINFLIIAFCVFLLVKAINNMRDAMEDPAQPDPSPSTKSCPFCCSGIPVKASRCPNCTSQLDTAVG
jgi:large conductance mechanosensitive channel